MNKLSALTVIAGLAVALTTMGAQAAFVAAAPNKPNMPASSEPDCSSTMGHMRLIRRADIEAIHGQHVTLIRICEDDSLVSARSYGTLFVDGNVDTLRQPIAGNETLITALIQEELDQHDVVSMRYGANDSVILYVFDRHMN